MSWPPPRQCTASAHRHGRCVGKGFDDARLDTLLLAMPVAWKGTLQQYAGRLHRTHASKVELIYD